MERRAEQLKEIERLHQEQRFVFTVNAFGHDFFKEIVKKRKNVFVNLKKIMKTIIFIPRRRKRRTIRKAQMNGQKMIIIYWSSFLTNIQEIVLFTK